MQAQCAAGLRHLEMTQEILAKQAFSAVRRHHRNGKTGKLTPNGQIVKTASPTCIVFAYF